MTSKPPLTHPIRTATKARSKAIAARDEQIGNPHGDGVDADGLPNDPIATAEDRIGANEDESQGEESAIGELETW